MRLLGRLHRRLLQPGGSAMTLVALVLHVGALVLAFGLRTWVHRRRTGSSGFVGASGPPGSPSWWAGVLFAAALLVGVASPALALTGVATYPRVLPADTGLATAGLALLVVSAIGVLFAQAGMGASWRIGVDEAERTDLVTSGMFAIVRNPIFTAMVAAQLGLLLAVPTWLSLVALTCLVAAVEFQVRVVEEPHLYRVHGSAYLQYAVATGRFVPGVGRADAHRPGGARTDGRH